MTEAMINKIVAGMTAGLPPGEIYAGLVNDHPDTPVEQILAAFPLAAARLREEGERALAEADALRRSAGRAGVGPSRRPAH